MNNDQLAQKFAEREKAMRKLQASADQMARDLNEVVDLTDEIWRNLPSRPLATPPTYSRNLFGRLHAYLWGKTSGRIGAAGVNPFIASQQPDLVSLCQGDREIIIAHLSKANAEAA